VKEGPKDWNLVATYSPIQKGSKKIAKYLFHSSALKESKVIAFSSRDIETVVHDQSFIMDLTFACGDAKQ